MGESVSFLSFLRDFILSAGILVAATFAKGSADLLSSLTNIDMIIWTTIIFIYLHLITIANRNKIIIFIT